jgi:hypothetical protein
MRKIQVGAAAAAAVALAMQWLIVSHSVRWLLAGVLPH